MPAPDALAHSDDALVPPVQTLRGGLAVPRFGPDTVLSVCLPALPPPAPETAPGRRKAERPVRLPGDRTRELLTGGRLSDADEIPNGSRLAVVHTQARAVTPGAPVDGAAEMADALLSGGVLREGDWCGSLERSLRRGLERWANREMGMDRLRLLGGLELVYTDDALAYSAGVRLGKWREAYRARPDRAIGMFALRFQGAPRAVHVRRAVAELEAAWPGFGYGALNLIQNASASGVEAHTFQWGHAALHSNAVHMRLREKWDQLGQGPLIGLTEDDEDEDFDELSEGNFYSLIPAEAACTSFRLVEAQRIAEEAPRTHPGLAPLASAVMGLWDACRAAGLSFHCTNHHPLLSWRMFMHRMPHEDQTQGASVGHDIPSLVRAPCAYTVWSPDDMMGRLVDDYHEFSRSAMAYSDLTWMHCFQVGHAGVEPKGARQEIERRERLVKKAARTSPESVSFLDPDYRAVPMPDGGLRHAVKALRLALGIVSATDRLLSLLHRPETLIERAKWGTL